MSRILARFRTPVYKNTGSVARDHLASERTFLAWLRTGLGFVALGTAIERFSQLDVAKVLPTVTVKSESQTSGRSRGDDSSDALVGALLGTGSGSIIYGTARYFSTMRLLQQGLFKPAYYGAGSMGVAVAGLVGTIYCSAQRAGSVRQVTI
ncbi:hypothetical protein DFH08DRAFT_209646 [Mycena albidolilacea]|uniref:DUF202 domain-containing protein n=1 Tax=Mycena albidolilacea TaxID=1033008 RepID=A0AAD7A0I9_9AGAR|nr:hypothetical protein DFH08DRAFT_209646 [Mycena albidolilacea]